MKKLFLAFLTVALLLCAGTVVWAIVEGTPHDVNVMQDTTGLEICAMCHTPHQGDTVVYPLWNRTQTAQTYTLYQSPTFDMYGGDPNALRNPSTLCMACHNGIESTLVNYPGPKSVENTMYNFNSSLLVDNWTNLGVAMGGEHPVSFDYNPALDTATDDNGFPEAVALSVGAVTRNYILGTDGNYPLYGDGDDFECSTCHAVHHTAEYDGPEMDNGKSVGTQVYFLRSGNAGSQMCTDCHTKR